MMDPTRPASDVWLLRRKPVDIQGHLMIRLDFQLNGWQTTVHHKMVKDLREADDECARIREDMASMLDGPFRNKYKIAHDLRGGL
jgi:hypothetical protein